MQRNPTVPASLVVVLEDARATALLAAASYVVVLAGARPTALLALASYAVVLVDAEPPHFLASAFYAAVLADALSIALLSHTQDVAIPLLLHWSWEGLLSTSIGSFDYQNEAF